MDIFNAKEFLNDNHIMWRDSGPDTHDGWIQVNCPFCGDRLFHGGFKLATGRFSCWRCGGHETFQTISRLTNTSLNNAKKLYYKHKNLPKSAGKQAYTARKTNALYQTNKQIILPTGTGKLQDNHIQYLIKRNFDHNKIEKKWNLLGTENIGDYKFRIIAPIYLAYKLVSYQGRDITNKSKQRYKACSLADEVYHHKNTLYGIDNVKGDTVVVVEGITDVWRLGYGSVSTFGIEYTQQQVNMLANNFKNIFIIFDKGDQAQEKAHNLGSDLSMFNINVEIITLDDVEDPADLNDIEAQHIMRQLL